MNIFFWRTKMITMFRNSRCGLFEKKKTSPKSKKAREQEMKRNPGIRHNKTQICLARFKRRAISVQAQLRIFCSRKTPQVVFVYFICLNGYREMFVLEAEANILERCNFQHSQKGENEFPAVMLCEYLQVWWSQEGGKKATKRKKYLKMH